MFRTRVCLLGAIVFLVGVTSHAYAQNVEFSRDVLPVLEKHCLDCHGKDQAESDLRLDSLLHALRGGNSGEPAVVPGKTEQSYLLARVTHKDPKKRMPPDAEPLTNAEIDVLRRWIHDSAGWKDAQQNLTTEKVDHWSFQPVQRPAVPEGPAHPIDAFITDRLKTVELEHSEQAERHRLIRRLSLVMTGLPPTPREIDRFLKDTTENAWESQINRVLESPHHGERMATFWLDLVRFGETHGFETNRERPNAWRYRDWVVDSFNNDRPYNEFITAQLAGDSIGEDAGTGFLVAGPYDIVKGQDELLRLTQRQDELADMINTTGTAFLGLTLGCARCHNHKFDPVSQTDYYAMQAVFAGVNHADRPLPLSQENQQQLATVDQKVKTLRQALKKFVPNPTPATREAVTAKLNVEMLQPIESKFIRFAILETSQAEPCIDELEIFSAEKNLALASAGAKASSSGDFVHPLHKLEHINDGRYGNARSWISSKSSGGWVQIELAQPAKIDRIVWSRDREGKFPDRLAIDYRIESSLDGKSWTQIASSATRQPYKKKTAKPRFHYDFAGFPKDEANRGQQQLARLKVLLKERERLAKQEMVYAGTFSQPGPTRRLYRGDPVTPREEVSPAAVSSLSEVSLERNSPERQRRIAIAKWIVDEKNPLTARVMVNRLWQFHFGTGLVDTPSDFGGNGTKPTHPELLDWLAVEFIEHDWSIKHMHRLILTSKTWQQDSRPRKNATAIDAGSRLLWRFPPRRLEAEGIRDSILRATGKLNLQMGGPGFSPFEVQNENVRHYFPKKTFNESDWRRMIYMTRVRQEREAVFGVFDCPDFNQVVPERSRSTTPLQALNLLNSHFVMQQAAFFVERLDRDAKTPAQKVNLAYQLCFARPADETEIREALQFIAQTDWQQFARAMLNANEFVFIP